MKALYRMNIEMKRSSNLQGIFVADKKYVEILISEEIPVYFGEVAGKFSEIYCTIEENELQMITDDPKVIEIFEEYKLSSGLNPFDYSTGSSFKYKGLEEVEDLSINEIIEKIIELKIKSNE